jgi:hypothetical protein
MKTAFINMYRDTVNDVVKAKVEETTKAKGIKLIKLNDYSPIFEERRKQSDSRKPLWGFFIPKTICQNFVRRSPIFRVFLFWGNS